MLSLPLFLVCSGTLFFGDPETTPTRFSSPAQVMLSPDLLRLRYSFGRGAYQQTDVYVLKGAGDFFVAKGSNHFESRYTGPELDGETVIRTELSIEGMNEALDRDQSPLVEASFRMNGDVLTLRLRCKRK